MLVLITYDVVTEDKAGRKRLRKIAELCKDYGVRVQFSVFECDVTSAQWVVLKEQLLKTYNPQQDSLRFYNLGKNGQSKREHYGAKPSLDVFGDTLIV